MLSQAPKLSLLQSCHPFYSLSVLSQRYVPPDQVKGPTYTTGSASTPAQGSMPDGKPQRTLLGDPVPSVTDAAATSSQVTHTPCTLTYLGEVGHETGATLLKSHKGEAVCPQLCHSPQLASVTCRPCVPWKAKSSRVWYVPPPILTIRSEQTEAPGHCWTHSCVFQSYID